MYRNLAQRIEAWRDSEPLSARLVTLITLLLTIRLSLFGTITIGPLQCHLTFRIDDQLVATAHTMQISGSAATSSVDDQGGVPTFYYIHIHDVAEGDRHSHSKDTLKVLGEFNLSEPADTSSTLIPSFRTPSVIVFSSKAGLSWRALAAPAYEQGFGLFSGYMTTALPLSDTQHTLRITTSYFAVAGTITVLIGGWAGRVLVRRALLPLCSIESTVGKIAADDLTERATPHSATTEVGPLLLSLNVMLTQVEQSFETRQVSEQEIKRFVSDASYELRTPLAVISGYCEFYAMGGVPAERIEKVTGHIASEFSCMAAPIEDLLTLVRPDEGRPLEVTDIDLVKLADNTALNLQALDPTRMVGFTGVNSRTSPVTPIVPGDRDHLSQVFTNLTDSIARYTPEGFPVEIAPGRSGDTTTVEPCDHGPGIDETDRGRVSERFYRVDTSRNRKSGSFGLGLVIVSGILTAHRGNASFTKTKGGSFTVRTELLTA